MNIYLLENPNTSREYDVVVGFVIAAPHWSAARKMASEEAGNEGPKIWMNITKTNCRRIGTANDPTAEGIVLRSLGGKPPVFRAISQIAGKPVREKYRSG